MHRGSLYYMFAAKFGERMNLPNKMAMGKVSPGTESCGVRGASFGRGLRNGLLFFSFFFPLSARRPFWSLVRHPLAYNGMFEAFWMERKRREW